VGAQQEGVKRTKEIIENTPLLFYVSETPCGVMQKMTLRFTRKKQGEKELPAVNTP
jgi:hypothetical protein